MKDVFFPPSTSVEQYIGFSTPLYINNVVVGVYGAMLDASSFNKLIQPLAEIDTSWMTVPIVHSWWKNSNHAAQESESTATKDSFSYWVFTGDSLNEHIAGLISAE